MHDFSLFSLFFYKKKNMSSMYLHQKYVLYSDSFVISVSSSAINIMLHGRVNLVPMSVPRFCLSDFSLNVNVIFFRLLSCFLNIDRPSPCDMFGYNATTPIVLKIMPSGNFGRERRSFRNSLVSLIKVLPLELVVVNDGQKMRKYFQYTNHY